MAEELELRRDLFIEPTKPFINHLALDRNNRILFSGAYGLGKTSFILDFFSETEQVKNFGARKYNPVYLKPINYSVATNEDIFKYIKFDIIAELILTHKVALEDEQLKEVVTAGTFIGKNITDLLAPLLIMIPKLGKDYYDMYKEYKDLYQQYKRFKTEQKTELELTDEFLAEVFKKEGSIYESNVYTELIRRMLVKLKMNEGGKVENILIIDDLDRIDPHHIFRLFNVFAAHFDERVEKGNKFGFDKVMFVCDINNIESIFKHVYGTGTDFNGYLDKFFSRHVHYFDNRAAVEKIIDDVVKGFVFVDREDSVGLVESHKGSGGIIGVTEMLKLTIRELILQGKINLRALFRFSDTEIPIHLRKLPLIGFNDKFNYNLPIVLVIECLQRIFGDFFDLSQALKNVSVLKTSFGSEERYDDTIAQILTLTHYNLHKFEPIRYSFNVYPDSPSNIVSTLTILIHYDRRTRVYTGQGFEWDFHGYNRDTLIHFFKPLSKAVDLLKDIGFLR